MKVPRDDGVPGHRGGVDLRSLRRRSRGSQMADAEMSAVCSLRKNIARPRRWLCTHCC